MKRKLLQYGITNVAKNFIIQVFFTENNTWNFFHYGKKLFNVNYSVLMKTK